MKRLLTWIPISVALFLIAYVLATPLHEPGVDRAQAAFPLRLFLWGTIAVFVVALVFSFRRQMRQFANFELRPAKPDEVSPDFHSRVSHLTGMGFTALGGPVAMLASAQMKIQPLLAPDQRSYAAVFEFGLKRQVTFDFDSRLADGRVVNTSSWALAARAPVRRELLIQVFPGSAPEELLKRHEEALAALGSPAEALSPTPEGYVAICREGYRLQFAGLGVIEALRLLIPGKTLHQEPIATRAR